MGIDGSSTAGTMTLCSSSAPLNGNEGDRQCLMSGIPLWSGGKERRRVKKKERIIWTRKKGPARR